MATTPGAQRKAIKKSVLADRVAAREKDSEITGPLCCGPDALQAALVAGPRGKQEIYMPVVMRDDIAVERLRSLLRYEAETGLLYWKVSGGSKSAGSVAGTLREQGYVNICMGGRFYRAHRLAFAIYYGRWPVGEIDHINRIKNDNRICNLRECTKSENGKNKPVFKNSSSGIRGVGWDKHRKQWRASIYQGGKKISLGRFSTAEQAEQCVIRASASELA